MARYQIDKRNSPLPILLNIGSMGGNMEKISGIYQIKNIMNGDIYIGQSVNLYKRKYSHFNSLKNNTHKNKFLQKAYNDFGENCFIFSIILICEKIELTYYEQKLVDKLNPIYNIFKKCVNSSFGIICSDEVRRNLSNSHLGKKNTEEQNKKISESGLGEKNHFFGKKHSAISKEKISKAGIGRKASSYTREKMSLTRLEMGDLEKTKIEKGLRFKEKVISENLNGNTVTGTRNVGSKNPNAKLTKEEVLEIKILMVTKCPTLRKLSEMFNVSIHTMRKIKSNEIWRCVEWPINI